MPEPILTVPNQLTLLRMGLAPVVVVLVLEGRLRWAAFAFAVAAVTDLLDGLIARIGHSQSKLGAMLDPIADKLLLSTSFVVLTWAAAVPEPIPAWATVIILARDAIVLVAAIAVTLAHGARGFPPSWIGKWATALQLATVAVVLLFNACGWPLGVLRLLFVPTVAFSVASAVHYGWKASHP